LNKEDGGDLSGKIYMATVYIVLAQSYSDSDKPTGPTRNMRNMRISATPSVFYVINPLGHKQASFTCPSLRV
jgi:hypothetical protein